MFIHDQRNVIEQTLNQGREEGIEEGLGRGREEGIRQVAKRMRAADMAIAQIAQITGLSVEDIEAL